MNLVEEIEHILDTVFNASGVKAEDAEIIKEQFYLTVFLKICARLASVLTPEELHQLKEAAKEALTEKEKIDMLGKTIKGSTKAQEAIILFVNRELKPTIEDILKTFQANATKEEKEKFTSQILERSTS